MIKASGFSCIMLAIAFLSIGIFEMPEKMEAQADPPHYYYCSFWDHKNNVVYFTGIFKENSAGDDEVLDSFQAYLQVQYHPNFGRVSSGKCPASSSRDGAREARNNDPIIEGSLSNDGLNKPLFVNWEYKKPK